MIGRRGLGLAVEVKSDSLALSLAASASLDSAVIVVDTGMAAAYVDVYSVWWWR